MAWDKSDHPIIKWVKLSSEHLTQINDLELATLKIHVVLEDILRYLLASRLGISQPETALLDLRIDFAALSQLALVGLGDAHLIGAIRALNAARNALAHQVESPNVQSNLEKFCMEAGYLHQTTIKWPTNPQDQLIALKEAFDGAGPAVLDLAVAEEKKHSNSTGA